jgi:hypothetical protein
MKREPEFLLVPATCRERKDYWQTKPRTWEEIQEAEKAAAERKRLEEEQKAAEEEAFQLSKQAAEQERTQRFPKGHEDEQQ